LLRLATPKNEDIDTLFPRAENIPITWADGTHDPACETRWVHLILQADHRDPTLFSTPRAAKPDEPHPLACIITSAREVLLGMDVLHHWDLLCSGRRSVYRLNVHADCVAHPHAR
jgi:hypothetical protein